MAAPGPPPGSPFTAEQIQQMIAMEAQKRGMTVPEFQAFQRRQIEQEAAKAGMSPQEFIMRKQEEARQQFAMQQAQQQQQQQPQQTGHEGHNHAQGGGEGGVKKDVHNIPVDGTVAAKPEALAVAKFLRSQNLKTRTCIFNGQRKDMFKVKRAFRALHSDAYKKARSKDPLLPEVTNDVQARNAVQLLPMSMLALRVTKKDPHEGHNHAKPKKEKRVKGLWEVKIEQNQEFEPLMHYVWLYEGPQWKTKVWAGLALLAVFAVVLFPLWPLFMRQGVWYLSWGAMGLLGLFFAMAFFRLILFCITVVTVPPGLWLFPNLFEDVGFVDSFIPLYGWQEVKPKKGGKKGQKTVGYFEGGEKNGKTETAGKSEEVASQAKEAVSSAVETSALTAPARRHAAPTVEEADSD